MVKLSCYSLINSLTKNTNMDILTLGWVSVLALFTWSIAMVVWGRKGL
jgi:cytochrome b6-f complex subunit 8